MKPGDDVRIGRVVAQASEQDPGADQSDQRVPDDGHPQQGSAAGERDPEPVGGDACQAGDAFGASSRHVGRDQAAERERDERELQPRRRPRDRHPVGAPTGGADHRDRSLDQGDRQRQQQCDLAKLRNQA